MKQIYQKTAVCKEKFKTPPPGKPGSRERRAWQMEHGPDRKARFNKRWPITKKQRDELEAAYPGRNSFSYLISLNDTSCNNSLVRIEDINKNIMPEGASISGKKEHKGDGLFQVRLKSSLVLVQRKNFSNKGLRPPPVPMPQVRPIVRKHGINKPFSEFERWEWPIWRRARQEYWNNRQEQVWREVGYAQELRRPKIVEPPIQPKAYTGNSRFMNWLRNNAPANARA